MPPCTPRYPDDEDSDFAEVDEGVFQHFFEEDEGSESSESYEDFRSILRRRHSFTGSSNTRTMPFNSVEETLQYLLDDTPRRSRSTNNLAMSPVYNFESWKPIPNYFRPIPTFTHPAAGIIDDPELQAKIISSDNTENLIENDSINSLEQHPETFYHIYCYNPLMPFYGESGMNWSEMFESFRLEKYSFLAKSDDDFIPKLPEILKSMIFKKLDAQTIFECVNTSNTWNDMILDDYDSKVKMLRFQSSKRIYKMVDVKEDGTVEIFNRMVQYNHRFRFTKLPNTRVPISQ